MLTSNCSGMFSSRFYLSHHTLSYQQRPSEKEGAAVLKVGVVGRPRCLSMAKVQSEIAVRQLEDRQNAILMSVSRFYGRVFGKDWTEVESRQASILYRLSCLYHSFGISKCEAVRAQDSCENVGEAVSSGSGESSGELFDTNGGSEFQKEDPGELDGEIWSKKRNEVICPSGSQMSGDWMGEGELRRHEHNSYAEGAEKRLSRILSKAGATFSFKRVPFDYYEMSMETKRVLLGAASVDHLCKSIVMVNTQAHESVRDCSDRSNSKYYVVVVQYTTRLNAEKVRHFVYSLNNGKIPKKRFNLRLAPEEESNRLTGFGHNAVTPFGMCTDIPVILSDAVLKLQPEFFWLGGGEVDLKLGIDTHDFIRIINPFVTDCIY